MTVRRIYVAGLALQAFAAVRAAMYYHRNPRG